MLYKIKIVLYNKPVKIRVPPKLCIFHDTPLYYVQGIWSPPYTLREIPLHCRFQAVQ